MDLKTAPTGARDARPEESRRSDEAPRCIGLALLVCLGLATPLLRAEIARAACEPADPISGASVLCTGTDSTGFQAMPGVDGLRISVVSEAQINESAPGFPNAIGVNNGNTIQTGILSEVRVTQDNGVGIRGGDGNSIVVSGTILVDAVGGQGLSVGAQSPTQSGAMIRITRTGTVTGVDPTLGTGTATRAHGPLIQFRDPPAGGGPNRLLNEGAIIANQVTTGTGPRRVAILGSSGNDFVENKGVIAGFVQLGDGDDTFVLNGSTGRIDSNVAGVLDGGPGNDTLELGDARFPLQPFDLDSQTDFEVVRVGGGQGWAPFNTAGFSGLLEIAPSGILFIAPGFFDPTVVLGGSLATSPTGTMFIALNESSPALAIGGDATFDGTLRVVNPITTAARATPYPLIDVTGTATGEFSSVLFSQVSDFKSFDIEYTASAVSVRVEDQPLAGLPTSANQRTILANLEATIAAGGASPEFARVLDQLEARSILGSASDFFDAFSPEAYDAQTTVLVESGRQIARLLFDRPRECIEGELEPWLGRTTPIPCNRSKLSPWVTTVGSFRQRDAFTGHPEYEANLGGLVAGLDARPIDPLLLSLSVASQRGSIDVTGSGRSTLTTTELAGQASWTEGPLRVQGMLGWGHGFHRDRRDIRLATVDAFSATAREEHDSDRITLASDLGVEFKTGPLRVEPVVGFDWSWVFQRPISEAGAAGLGLRIDERDDQVGSVTAGLRLSSVHHHTRFLVSQLEWMYGVWRPQIDLRWREFVEGNEREIDARLRGAPSDVGGYQIKGKEDRGGWEVGAGVSFIPEAANRFQFDLRYDAYVASHTLEHDLTLRVGLAF